MNVPSDESINTLRSFTRKNSWIQLIFLPKSKKPLDQISSVIFEKISLPAGLAVGVFRVRRFGGVVAVVGADRQGDGTFSREDSHGPRLSRRRRRPVTPHNEPDSSVRDKIKIGDRCHGRKLRVSKKLHYAPADRAWLRERNNGEKSSKFPSFFTVSTPRFRRGDTWR